MIGLDEIYDAAFDQRRVPAMLERLTRAFAARSAFIAWTCADRDAHFQAQFGNDPAWLQRYVENYAQHDILRPILQAAPEGLCISVYPHLQQADIQATVFYREYLAPQGIIDNLAVNLIKRPGIFAHIALLRFAPDKPFNEADVDRLATLIPHLRRAIYIQSHLVRAADHAASLQAAGGATGPGLLLDAERCVVEIDSQLAALVRLHPGKPLGDGIFGRAIVAAIDGSAAVAVELPAHPHPVPLLCEARALEQQRFGDLAAGPAASHVVRVTRLDQPRLLAFDAMATLYRLTPTELRVLRDAVERGDLAGIGKRLGMAAPTARTHLHRIYEKTATRSFAGLSNLANRFGRIPAG